MLGTPFYFATIRKTIVGIGAMFNNIHLVDTDIAGNVVKDIKVPLAYSKRSAYLAKLNEDARTSNTTKATTSMVTLPRMSYEMLGITYDNVRQKNPLNQSSYQSPTNNNSILRELAPVPYDLAFSINIFSNDIEDGLQIIEQILPTFTPAYNLSIKMIPEMNIVEDVQVMLDTVETEDNFESGFEENRLITWTLGLTAKTNIYQPVTTASRISYATTNMSNTKDMSNQLVTMGIAVNPITAKITDPHTITTTRTEY